jgi:hypothetical protein
MGRELMAFRFTIEDGKIRPLHGYDSWIGKRITFERMLLTHETDWTRYDPSPRQLEEFISFHLHEFAGWEGEVEWYEHYLHTLDKVDVGVYDVVVAQDWLD